MHMCKYGRMHRDRAYIVLLWLPVYHDHMNIHVCMCMPMHISEIVIV